MRRRVSYQRSTTGNYSVRSGNLVQYILRNKWMLAFAMLVVLDVCVVYITYTPLDRIAYDHRLDIAVLKAHVSPEPLAFWDDVTFPVDTAKRDDHNEAHIVPVEKENIVPIQQDSRTHSIKNGQTFVGALHELDIDQQTASTIAGVIGQHTSLRYIKPGEKIIVTYQNDVPIQVQYRKGMVNRFIAREENNDWTAYKADITPDIEISVIQGSLQSSLYESILKLGESPLLASKLSDIFSWEIDFFSDPRTGDNFSMVLQKASINGVAIPGETKILAALYDGDCGTYQAYNYGAEHEFYNEEGRSLQKAFLKAPLQYAHVTSSYGRRIHPVLRYSKKHNGIDYRSPVGTPVWTIADGTVVKSTYDRLSGRYVVIRHPMGYESIYAHLSKSKVRVGQRVSQKQIIAKTGNTGRSTGPHLHFGLKRYKRFVNPATQKYPQGKPIKDSERAYFEKAVKRLQPLLTRSLQKQHASMHIAQAGEAL